MSDATLTGAVVPGMDTLESDRESSCNLPQVNYDFSDEPVWRSIPAWSQVKEEEFGNHRWQWQNSVSSVDQLARVLGERLRPDLLADLRSGQDQAAMNIRLTPYILSLFDWDHPETDPLRRQFLPLGSELLPDHPMHQEDSLDEEGDRKAPFLTHRYHDKALFLPTTICPVYCSYCTRSRVVGGSTSQRNKATYGAKGAAWGETFDYIREHGELEDIVVSGGDSSMLKPDQLEWIGRNLLEIPHLRRIRFATKGIGILPMQITSDDDWVGALKRVVDLGRERFKEVCLHTHIGCESEITDWTEKAMRRLFSLGIKVRNQAVLLRGVNDEFLRMYRLIKKLSWLNIQPYYVYVHDMVPGCEHLRTTVDTAERLSQKLLGTTAGFNLPRFVCDAPGGGGKREISSYQYYDRSKGISAWTAPSIKPGRTFFYYDPLDRLPEEGRDFWDRAKTDEGLVIAERQRIEASLNLDGRLRG